MNRRKSFIVYYENFELSKYNNVNVVYNSKKENYAVCYCDYDFYKGVKNKMLNDKNIISIEESLLEHNADSLVGGFNEN